MTNAQPSSGGLVSSVVESGGVNAPSNGAFHPRLRFDPLLILAQIVLLQATFYTSYLVLLVLFHRATATTTPISDQIFDYTRLTLAHFPGWVSATALLISALGPTALAFVSVVGRSKRALDFSATLFISHLVATTLHSGFPLSLVWWLLNLLAAAGLAAVSEALSLRLELRDISVSRTQPATSSGLPSGASVTHDRDGKSDVEDPSPSSD